MGRRAQVIGRKKCAGLSPRPRGSNRVHRTRHQEVVVSHPYPYSACGTPGHSHRTPAWSHSGRGCSRRCMATALPPKRARHAHVPPTQAKEGAVEGTYIPQADQLPALAAECFHQHRLVWGLVTAHRIGTTGGYTTCRQRDH
jgi:hypothetical protein